MQPHFPRQLIVQCPHCRLVFYDGNVQSDALYSQDYFEGGEYLDYQADKNIHQMNFKDRIDELRRWKPQGRLLEIGSAYGFFLELAQRHWQASGMDVTPEGVDHAKKAMNLDARLVDFLTLPEEVETYDLICLWDTVEHLPHPVRVMEKAGRWLKPGGVLAVTTGDIGSGVARWRKERWRQVHPPTHLFYFSEETLRRGFEQAGLRVQVSRYAGYSRSFKSMAYGAFALHSKRWAWLYRGLTLNGRLDFPVYLNLYDIRLMIGIKPEAR
jgi:SAM-dependent methyltransferase